MGEFSFPRLVVFCLLLTSLLSTSNLFQLFFSLFVGYLIFLFVLAHKQTSRKEKKGREVGGLPVNVLSFKRGQRPFVSSPTLPPNAISIPLPLVAFGDLAWTFTSPFLLLHDISNPTFG